MTIIHLFFIVAFLLIGTIMCYISFQAGHEKMHRYYTIFLLTISTILLTATMMLVAASKTEIAIGQIQSNYAAMSTIELLGDIRNTNHQVEVEENHIYIDRGTAQEKCYILVKEPYFSIIRKDKLQDFAHDIGNL